MLFEKISPIHIAVFLFPILIATMRHGGGVLYVLLLLFGLFLGWSAWRSLETWEKKVLIGFSIFFILVSLSLVNTQDFDSGMKKVERYIHFPLMIPMYLLLRKYQVEVGRVFFYGLLIASIVMFGQSIYQIIELSAPRAVGAYNPLILGDISMLVVMIIVCALFTIAQSYHHYILGGVAIALALSASVMTGARGAWLMLPIAVIWFLWIKRKDIHVKGMMALSLVGCLVVGVLASSNIITKRIDVSIENFQGLYLEPSKVTSISIRLNLWRDAVTIWKEHPFIGTGIGDFKSHKAKLFEEGRSKMRTDFGHAHNIYFDVLATAGVVGLFSMVIFVMAIPFLVFFSHWKNEEDPWLKFYALAGMTTIISFTVFGLTEGWLARNPFVRTYLMCILVFMSSIAVAKSRATKEAPSEVFT